MQLGEDWWQVSRSASSPVMEQVKSTGGANQVEFEKTVLKLKDGHTWRCKPGWKIFVLGQGALRFDVPEDWVLTPGEASVKFYDCQPPGDDCCLQVSLLRHSQIDWSGLPLDQLLRDSVAGRSGELIRHEDIHRQSRPGADCAWVEKHFVDPQQGKPARSRIMLVRGTQGHALVTLDFWETDAQRVIPVWDEVLRSVDMGLKIDDPTMGERRM